jgi:hypothetical protein
VQKKSYPRAFHKSIQIHQTPPPLRERLLEYLSDHGGEVYFDEAVMSDLIDDGWTWHKFRRAVTDLRRRGLVAIRTFAGVKVVQALVDEFQEAL